MSVFKSSNYKHYLDEIIKSKPGKGHGFRTQIAAAIGSHSAYVYQVLKKDAHFSPEQTEELNHFLGHSQEEGLYFHLLVQKARAGTQRLKQRVQSQINILLEKRMVLKERVEIKKALSALDQTKYYSAWYYPAIHILITLPEFRTKEAISKRLNLSMEWVNEVLEFLVSTGLVSQDGQIFKPGVTELFLGSDSIMISKHHTNWRMKALESLGRPGNQDLHYSTVVSLSFDDVRVIKEIFIKAISDANRIIKDSKEEDLQSLCIDIFRI